MPYGARAKEAALFLTDLVEILLPFRIELTKYFHRAPVYTLLARNIKFDQFTISSRFPASFSTDTGADTPPSEAPPLESTEVNIRLAF